MDFIAKLLEKTSGLLRGVVLLSYLFIGFCSIVKRMFVYLGVSGHCERYQHNS